MRDKIEIGQQWVGNANKIAFTVVKVTEKSVTVTWEVSNEDTWGTITKRAILSKEQMLRTMERR